MKSKQVLSIEQMQHLQELGLKLKPSYSAYTLQDILELLPYKIVASYLNIGKKSFSGDVLFYIEYSNLGGYAISHFRSESLLDAAYEMLCWVLTNKYI